MRWRRAILFSVIVAAHVLIVWLFPIERAQREPPEQEISLTTLLSPEPVRERSSLADSRKASGASHPVERSARIKRSTQIVPPVSPIDSSTAVLAEPPPVGEPSSAPAFVDWAKEAQVVADERARSDADNSRKHYVTPAPIAPTFPWDYAATHRIESSARGLIVNLNDRCSLLISLSIMAVMTGCKLGDLPANGNLLMHMKDPASSAPVTR
jgi:hypothetical protein